MLDICEFSGERHVKSLLKYPVYNIALNDYHVHVQGCEDNYLLGSTLINPTYKQTYIRTYIHTYIHTYHICRYVVITGIMAIRPLQDTNT